MSGPAPPADAVALDRAGPSTLELSALRTELDGIDDAIHDLLMRRAGAVSRLARSGVKGGVTLRPGREAAIMRRLLGRHSGPLPRHALVRIWRELLAATTAMQGPFVVAVCEPDPGCGTVQCAREHFGNLTPLQVHRSPAQAMAEVGGGGAAVAVLPAPSDADVACDAWWTPLMADAGAATGPRIFVVARLPFWSPRPQGTPLVQAFALAAAPPDPSGIDRSLLGIELPPDLSRAQLMDGLLAAGLHPASVILRRDPGAAVAQALVDVEGWMSADDRRLDSPDLARMRPLVLGGYAVPEQGSPA